MEPPPVHYLSTSDGYKIAYTVSGEGTPLILVPFHFSHTQLDWRPNAPAEPWMSGLSKRFRLVHYDPRGQGMSTRDLPADLPFEAWRLDLEAVVERLLPERFVLLGINIPGHIAVRFAVAHPEMLKALILINCRVTVAGWMLPLTEQSWDLYLRTQLPAGVTASVQSEEIARIKQAVKQADFLTYIRAFSPSDVFDDLAKLRMPTLVLHGRDLPWFNSEQATILAAQIPQARLVLLDGDVMPNATQGLQAIDAFLEDLATQDRPVGTAPVALLEGLSAREIEVLRLLAAGNSNQQIAEELVISINTVGRHVSNIFDKIGTANRTEAAAFAQHKGIL